MHINPPQELDINENPKNSSAKNIEKKRLYYDQLAAEIAIDGIVEVVRDVAFDDDRKYNSGGIRLHYKKHTASIEGVKDGILLEAGYDNVAPNSPVTITSWAYEKAVSIPNLDIINNRAVDVLCYDPRYTLVEKLQTIATKFRKEMETGTVATNYMRQYYDVYSLLDVPDIVAFIGSEEYLHHKALRFPPSDLAIPVKENEAFLLSDEAIKKRLQERYEKSKGLYYKGQPLFEEVLARIYQHIDKM